MMKRINEEHQSTLSHGKWMIYEFPLWLNKCLQASSAGNKVEIEIKT